MGWESYDEAVAQLRRQRLTIIKVDESKSTPKKTIGSIKMRDIVIFTVISMIAVGEQTGGLDDMQHHDCRLL